MCVGARTFGVSSVCVCVSCGQLANDPHWPPFIAAWKLYRHTELSELVSVDLGSSGARDRLTALLLWASRFAMHLMDVADHPVVRAAKASAARGLYRRLTLCMCTQERQRILQAHLMVATVHVRRSCELPSAGRGVDSPRSLSAPLSPSAAGSSTSSCWTTPADMRDVVMSLWCHQFASLIPEPGTEASILGSPAVNNVQLPFPKSQIRMSFDVLLAISQHQYPPNAEWSWTTTTLSHLMHGNGSSRDVSTLIENHRSFWSDLGDEATEVARFVFKCDRLSRVAQVATLQTNVNISMLSREEAVLFARRLELGLKSMHSFDKVRLNGALGDNDVLRRNLKEFYTRNCVNIMTENAALHFPATPR